MQSMSSINYYKGRKFMEKKLKQFLDKTFAPYGDFPARADVTKELGANLFEKYKDLKKQGMSDDEAYHATIDSFGDVEEIMEQFPHTDLIGAEKKQESNQEHKSGFGQTLKKTFEQAKSMIGLSRFSGADLAQADLSDSNLVEENFSGSALMEVVFNGSDLTGAIFRGSALKGASFVKANLTNATFAASDLQEVTFKGANLTGSKFKAAALHGATFDDATLNGIEFRHTDLDGISFDNQELDGVVFNASSLKKTSFKNATLRNVSFHHSEVKHTIFDGAKMDKVTYALLKGAEAVLDKVTFI